MRSMRLFFVCIPCFLLLACSTSPSSTANYPTLRNTLVLSDIEAEGIAREVVIFAMGLLDVAYQFGGANPEAGLDCSGMVGFIYTEVAGIRLPHNAAALARIAQPIKKEALKARQNEEKA